MIRKFILPIFLIIAGLNTVNAQTTPPDMVVNRFFELYSGTADPITDPSIKYDAIELLVVKDHLDIRGWIVQELGIAGSNLRSLAAGGKFKFKNHPLWSNLRSGTIITIRENVVVGQEAYAGGGCFCG